MRCRNLKSSMPRVTATCYWREYWEVNFDRDFSSDLGPNTSSKHEAFHRKDNPARKMGFGREDGDVS